MSYNSLSHTKRNYNGEKLWARGYASSSVGFNEEQVRHYIKHQEQLDSRENLDVDDANEDERTDGE